MTFDAFVAPDDGLAAGARTLHGLICDHVDQLNQLTGLGSIIDVIKPEPSRVLGLLSQQGGDSRGTHDILGVQEWPAPVDVESGLG